MRLPKTDSSGYGALLFVLITAISLIGFLFSSHQSYFLLQREIEQFISKHQSILLATSCRSIAMVRLSEVPELIIGIPKAILLSNTNKNLECSIDSIQLIEKSGIGLQTILRKQIQTSAIYEGIQSNIYSEVKITNFHVELISSKQI